MGPRTAPLEAPLKALGPRQILKTASWLLVNDYDIEDKNREPGPFQYEDAVLPVHYILQGWFQVCAQPMRDSDICNNVSH